jgi:pilus assembly protein TadC
MLYTCRELKSGVSEGNAYEHFGKRTGLQEYIRLCTLMTQNLKKGSASLVPRLREEVDKSLTERIRMGRKLGEEAATKLLVPMVMMLAVVMVMVMLPAFSSMGS